MRTQNDDKSFIDPVLRLTQLLRWEGRLNRSRVMELFGVGMTRASVLIREFREAHPDWLVWDERTRSFHATGTAYRALSSQDRLRHRDAAVSLAQYVAIVGLPSASGTRTSHQDQGLVAAFTDWWTPEAQHFAALQEAVRLQQQVEITYRSLRYPEPHVLVISPHHLVRAGRWHARAYCATRVGFCDFALGRISSVKALPEEATHTVSADVAWQARVPVTLVAHPVLTYAQQRVVRFEHFGETAARTDTCRGALVRYYIQEMRAALDVERQCPPEYLIAVHNREEISPWLIPADD